MMLAELEKGVSSRLQGENANLIDDASRAIGKANGIGMGRPAGVPGARKLNPKSTPRALQYAREYGRKRRKAAKAAKGPGAGSGHFRLYRKRSISDQFWGRAPEIIEEFARPSCRADYRKLDSLRVGRCADVETPTPFAFLIFKIYGIHAIGVMGERPEERHGPLCHPLRFRGGLQRSSADRPTHPT